MLLYATILLYSVFIGIIFAQAWLFGLQRNLCHMMPLFMLHLLCFLALFCVLSLTKHARFKQTWICCSTKLQMIQNSSNSALTGTVVDVFIAHQHADHTVLMYRFFLSVCLFVCLCLVLILCWNGCTNLQTFFAFWSSPSGITILRWQCPQRECTLLIMLLQYLFGQ